MWARKKVRVKYHRGWILEDKGQESDVPVTLFRDAPFLTYFSWRRLAKKERINDIVFFASLRQ